MRPVNLLPDSSRAHRPTGRLSGSAYGVVGVLAVLLVMAVAYVLTTNQINDRQTQIAVAEQETEEARQKVASLAAFGDFAAVKQARLTEVRDKAAVRFDWERLMREVAHVIPSDIWLLDLTASTSAQDASGGVAPATSGAPSALGSSPSLKVVGCARTQESVAQMMVRLRKLHRAEDVELVESVIEAAASGGAVADSAGSSTEGCAGRYKFDVDVTFSPPTPEDAGAHVPVALGGGS
jgi:Tfp pilus assembly protein PilN